MEDDEKEAILRAKQAISPAGIGDRSDKATTLPGNDAPEDTPLSGMDVSPTEDGEDDDTPTTHPNRANSQESDLDKPSYS